MFSISSYFSAHYMALLLPLTVLAYAVFSQKARRWVLLVASYVFFWAISGKLLVFLLYTTFVTFYSGKILWKMQKKADEQIGKLPKEQKKTGRQREQRRQLLVLSIAIISQLGVLTVIKYTPFLLQNVNKLVALIQSPIKLKIPKFIQPIGISFYTLQALSYLFDVYRKKLTADQNLLRFALYMSFFPQIMEGPICRYEQTAQKLWEAPAIQYSNVIFGIQRILYGMMKKIVVADRLNLFVQKVFDGYAKFDGFVIAVAAACYTLQLYMDFSGTMDVVIGSGEIFGISMPENFKRPFFSASISEFWKRWHVTLGAWFKDYIFYPVSMSKPIKKLTLKLRKKIGNHFGPLLSGSIALFCVWLCNGLWHGAGWNYIFFGMYHFMLILSGNAIMPVVLKISNRFHIVRNSKPYHCMQIVRTTVLVCIGELFFRANGLRAGLLMFQKIFTQFQFTTIADQSFFQLGLDKKDLVIVFVSVILIVVIGIIQEKGISIRQKLAGKDSLIQYTFLYALILFIVIFGAYGSGYVPVDPMYANF